MNKVDLVTVSESSTIRDAMESINKSGIRMVFVIDENRKLLGIASDGDIRRAFSVGKNFDTPIKDAMKTDPITAPKDTPVTKLLEIMIEKGIQEIPIIDKDKRVLGIVLLSELKSIPLSNPDITHEEVDVIKQVLSTPFLSIGPKIKEFESKIANYIGRKYAIAVNSGTSGLHLCVKSLDIKDGDEVITSPFSFISSANCILFERAKPVFVDIDENTLCIDPDKIEEKITKKTKAILPVHIFGHPCEMQKIMEIARKYNLSVIEDACEALGADYKDKKVGSFGNAAVFAFYPNKQITTAEGGMIVTDDEKIAKLCQSMRNQGRDEGDDWLSHSRLGYNYRMTELSAALGVTQMDRIEEILGKRQKVANIYNERLSKIGGIKIPYVSSDVKISWFVYVIRLDEKRFSQKDRNRIIQELQDRGIDCRDYFPPIHLEPLYVNMFDYKEGSFPITEKVSSRTIALPFYNNLTEEDIDYTCSSLEKILK